MRALHDTSLQALDGVLWLRVLAFGLLIFYHTGPLWLERSVVAAGALGIGLALHELAIRRWSTLRFLFGLKRVAPGQSGRVTPRRRAPGLQQRQSSFRGLQTLH